MNASLTNLYHGPTVTIHVGTGCTKKTYTLAKLLLCHQSSYFRAVFTGGFKEEHEQTLDLDDVDPEIFNMVVQWLYTETLYEPSKPDFTSIVKLLILSDRLAIVVNEVQVTRSMRALLTSDVCLLDLEAVRDISSLPRQHSARILAGEAMVRRILKPGMEGLPEGVEEMKTNLEFAVDVLDTIRATMRSGFRDTGRWRVEDPLTGVEFIMVCQVW